VTASRYAPWMPSTTARYSLTTSNISSSPVGGNGRRPLLGAGRYPKELTSNWTASQTLEPGPTSKGGTRRLFRPPGCFVILRLSARRAGRRGSLAGGSPRVLGLLSVLAPLAPFDARSARSFSSLRCARSGNPRGSAPDPVAPRSRRFARSRGWRPLPLRGLASPSLRGASASAAVVADGTGGPLAVGSCSRWAASASVPTSASGRRPCRRAGAGRGLPLGRSPAPDAAESGGRYVVRWAKVA
jgi:hypothetical protein